MKILHKSKRAVPPPSQVAELITKLLNTSNDDLADVLADMDTWKWPRSDLNAWIKVLNKFDEILEEVIRDYDVDKLQINVFTPATKKIICEVLRFERLLLENSTNRKLFSSYDRLNSLLFTSDLDVLILALNLLLRPSQQYSAQPSVSHALSISTPRLQSLAKRWPHLHEHGIGLADLVTSTPNPQFDATPPETREVNFSFYRTEDSGPDPEKKMDTDVFDAPQGSTRKPQLFGSGAVNIHLDEKLLLSKSAMDVLADTIDAFSVPDGEKYDLMCRIRAARVLTKGQESDRQKLLIVRLLAIAIFGHTHTENQATTSLFLYEPDLIAHIAELLQADREIPVPVQTAAIAALDALARYRGRIQEVLAAVNAGVNHGILMALFRKSVVDVSNPDSTLPHSFVEALLSFVTFIASHASGGNMIVGAGLIPLLIQVIENRVPHRIAVVSKTMQLVDNVLYSFTNAFHLFCTSRGIEVLVERIEYEIESDIELYGDEHRSREIFGSHGDLPVARAAVLKHILRSMHRMMQSSGTAEGLRGLIDMPILKSVKKIIEYRGLFGPSILPIAINIMATFVHNEPTSLSIIQEAGLPDAFYNTIESGLEPAIEVIQAIPNAIGALCLNETGQAQLAKRPSIIPAIFSIFTSDRHLKVLLDKENAVLIGTAIDELIRHHPTLKSAVFESLKSTISKIEELGHAFSIPPDLRQWYKLAAIPSSLNDMPMDDEDSVTDALPSTGAGSADEADDNEDPSTRPHDNNVVTFIDALGRFLEGLFQHTPHCKDFISATDGLIRLGRLTALPCLPYDFANSVASDSMVQVMRTMTEVYASETLLHLAQLVKESLESTRNFWDAPHGRSILAPLAEIAESEEESANNTFRNLITLHTRITLLSDVFSTAGYAHGRAAIALLQTLMSNTSSQVVTDLGALHRAAIWEDIILGLDLAIKGIGIGRTPSPSPHRITTSLPEPEGAVQPNMPNGTVQSEPTVGPNVRRRHPSRYTLREQNAIALKHLSHGLPSALAPFFQAMVKMFHARRNPDAAQKKQISESSAVVADVMLRHLTPRSYHDTSCIYAYYSVIINLMNALLVDERTSTSTLHTVQLLAFYRATGLDGIISVCRMFTSAIEDLSKIKSEDRELLATRELAQAYEGLKAALELIHPLISSKPLFESGQTLLIVTRDKANTDPDYFEPHNFLVKIRLTITPLLRLIWEAPWLLSAPVSLIRTVVRTVLELTNGESEESQGDHLIEVAPIGGGPIRPTAADEGRIAQLTDMGFPRSAAQRALARTHNNVNAATDMLLAHPYPFPPDPEPTAPEQSAEQPGPETDVAVEGESNVDIAEAAPAPNPPSDSDPPTVIVGKTPEAWQIELDEAREPLRARISRQALHLIDEHVSLLFDLHGAFIRPPNMHQRNAIQDLIDDIKAFSPYAYDVREQPLANRCRLLALVLCETPSSLNSQLRATLMDNLLALLLSDPVEADTIPQWLAAHLLVTEALLTLADEPRTITIPAEDEPIPTEALTVGPPLTEARKQIFNFCFRLLGIPDLRSDELLSTLRLFVLFTRDHALASQFVQGNGLVLLFKRLRSSTVHGSSSYIATILRHIVEGAPVVQQIMRQAVKRYFTQSRTRVVDVATYLRNCSAMALREPTVFIDVTQSMCQLGHPFSPSPHVSLKLEPPLPEPDTSKPDRSNGDMVVDVPPSGVHATDHESVENIIHLLMAELINIMKTVNELSPERSDSTIQASSSPTKLANTESEATNLNPSDSDPDGNVYDQYGYACFLMQCLTELLFSYDACKLAILSYSPKKRTQTPSKEGSNKFKTVTLHFFLSELIAFGTINPQPTNRAKNRITLCNWAMSVIVALCVDTSSIHEAKEISPDLLSVRKFVLEAINRAIKDLAPSENVEPRYGRLLALADLCHRLLTVHFNNSSRRQQDDTPTHIAKVMLDKGFVATLTTALADVDLNYPNVKGLVASMLRPLEYLTKIAIKMNRASGRVKEPAERGAAASVLSMTSDEEEEEVEGREETPDLYRNSALGMYGGEMDDGNYAGEDEMHDDDDGEDEDVEMEYGEETGSEDTSNTDEDEDEEMDGHQDSEEAWDDVEDEEAGLVEQDDEDEGEGEDHGHDDDDDDDDDDDGGDEDMMWQDIHVGADGLGGDDGLDEEERLGVSIPIIHTGDEDEVENPSDEEEYIMGDVDNNVDQVFGFGGSFTNQHTRDAIGLFHPRRHQRTGDDGTQVFGRARNAPPSAPEATTHPLLLDTSSSAGRVPPSQARASRHQHRLIGTSSELHPTMEELIGGVQLFHHIMTRGRGGGGPETIRIDMPSVTVVNLDRNGAIQSRRNQAGVFTTSMHVGQQQPNRSERNGRELDPLLTLQRWAEEVKILHGEFVAERVGKLTNHVTLALLPAAIEAAAKQKIREQEEAEAQRKQEADREEAAATEAKNQAESITPEVPTEQPTVEAATVPPQLSQEVTPVVSTEPASTSPQEDQVMEDAQSRVDGDTDMADLSPTPAPTAETSEPPSAVGTLAGAPVEPSVSTIPTAAERISVMIHGSSVDITDTGIDPTFLEALPDDMREEVLNQHVRDQRAARVERPPDSQISTEFLDALPPEIRAEIIQQEALERARRELAAPAGAPTRVPVEIDPASFIASLDPTLRQAVLLDQDEGFIQTLPSHMIAEAGVYRDGLQPRRHLATRGIAERAIPPGGVAKKFTPQHDAVRLLEKPGIAVLVRLLFFPQVLRKNLLFKVLVNLCENAKTRTELFNFLLSILQDGPGDLAAVDKSFAQMSFRNSKLQTPKAAGKQKVSQDYLTSLALPSIQHEAVPDLIAQRCLEALTYIVSSNELSSLFFLTEHELPVGLRKPASKKGKGKEKPMSQTHFPIVLLLGLLDKQSLLRTPAVMESVAGLLATVTRPLSNLKDTKKTPDVPMISEPEVPAVATEAPADSSQPPPPPPTSAPGQPESSEPSLVPQEPQSSTQLADVPPPEGALVKEGGLSIEAAEEKILLANPPQIPHAVLRLIVNILTVGECSARTFQQSLALIQHLSYIPDARDVIAQELKVKAQEFGHTLYTDLDELAGALQTTQGDLLISAVSSKFSPASSVQAKLLRVLKTIDYMFSSKSASTGAAAEDDADKVQAIYESFRFTPLWRRLGDCLSVIEEKSDIDHIATVLLPLIEALMVVCKYVGSKTSSTASARALRASASPRTPTTPRESMEDLFVTFTDAHRKVLNLMVRNNPSLMSGSFSLLVNNPRVLDFDNKRNYFSQQLHRRPHAREHHGTLQLNVRRPRVFEDSFQHLQRKTGDQIKYGKLSVKFYGEEGVDAGGVTREWFQILARQMFDPNNALFQPCAADKLTYQPNKNSWVNPEHLSFFKFVGRVIGKAIYDGRLLDAYFARSLYRQLLGKPVDYKDVEWVDPEYYNSLCWILENDPTLLELTFSVEADEFGINRIIPLKEGGEGIPVTQENKREFVQLSAQYRLYSSIRDQIESLATGFYEIIPKELITIFNEKELELLISGTPDIDVDEWRAATEYNGYGSSDPNIVWWWRALKSFNRDERAKVLSFATGTSRVPLSGFVDLQGVQGVQRFSIHRAYGESDRLPQAHTCFNQIDLPQYSSYEMLRQQLLLAINEGGEGFAFS